MRKYGSSEKLLFSYSQACFQTAYSNVEGFNASANYTAMEGIPTTNVEIPSSTIPVIDTHQTIEQFLNNNSSQVHAGNIHTNFTHPLNAANFCASKNNPGPERVQTEIVEIPLSTIPVLDTDLTIEQFLTSHHVKLAEMDTNNSSHVNAGNIHTNFTHPLNAANFCASTNNPGPERIPTELVEIPSSTIPVFDIHPTIEQFLSSHMELAEMDNNSYRVNTEEISTKFTHVNAENFCLLKTNQTGEFSTSFNEINSSKINLHNSQTDDFNNILPIYIHRSNASERHTNTSQEVKMSTKNIANALDICSKYTAHARSLKIALQNSQTDVCKIRSTNIHKTNASAGRTNTSQQVKTSPEIIPDALEIHSESTAQATTSKIGLQNSACFTISMRNKSKLFEDELVIRSKNVSKIPLPSISEIVPKVYLCDVCDSKYQWYYFLMIKNSTAAESYKCKLCSFHYIKRRSVGVHLRRCHFVSSNQNCELCKENSTSRTMRDFAPEFFSGTYRILR